MSDDRAEVVQQLSSLSEQLSGDVRTDRLHRMLYAQDASVYQEQPAAVAFPKDTEDVQSLVRTADALGLALIPRAGGTSLAGQCVGAGLVIDTGRHMNRILEVNREEKWVRVQPGVVLDELNRHLAQYDLFFGPDTSTSNRCMLGGMIGNNSCGSHSILYGNTRDHLLELEVVFADGECVRFGAADRGKLRDEISEKGRLAAGLDVLDRIADNHAELIAENYPRRDVLRRNTGYPLDELIDREDGEDPFSLPRFLCGTEGTLGVTTEAKLNLVDQPKKKVLVCVHFRSLQQALEATIEAINHDPAAVELMDRRVLEETKKNIEQARNRFWVEGDPDAVLVIEFYRSSEEQLQEAVDTLVSRFESLEMGYAYPVVRPPRDKAVWALRKAGLGLLMGIEGDVKPVTVVEDTAVAVDVLPEYVRDFSKIMDAYDTACVYYAHASVGELHLRPELNLKDPDDVERFRGIAEDVADLVKDYRGSLSGEHGDGRVRSPLLERFYGREIMELHRDVKSAFDPKGIFNPGNIVDPRPIDEDFRFEPGRPTPEVDTEFRWRAEGGLVRATELCNGAGVCRKKAEAGGTMCPSYMATFEERDSTRGRANTFRTLLTGEEPSHAFESDELEEALDLCLSCKACKSECPASVDMAKMKAEFLQHRHDHKGTPASAHFFGNFRTMSRLGAWFPWLANFMLSLWIIRWVLTRWIGVSEEREIPKLAPKSFDRLLKQYRKTAESPDEGRPVWLYVDPFTDFTEPEIGIAAVKVLEAAGYRVERFEMRDDGRTYLSKGLVRKGRKVAQKGLARVAEELQAQPKRPVIGLEPSALLTFRDELPDLVGDEFLDTANGLSERSFLFEEFLRQELEEENFDANIFQSDDGGQAVLHGHCHQKALVGTTATETILELAGISVTTLDTGCCGMAGSFGYEAQHYELSMEIGELVLFPALREIDEETLVVAVGTSCRDQIADGVDQQARHPAQVLADRLA